MCQEEPGRIQSVDQLLVLLQYDAPLDLEGGRKFSRFHSQFLLQQRKAADFLMIGEIGCEPRISPRISRSTSGARTNAARSSTSTATDCLSAHSLNRSNAGTMRAPIVFPDPPLSRLVR